MADGYHLSPTSILTGPATGHVRWQVSPEWENVLIGPQGLRLDEWLAEGRVHVVKHGSHRTVYRVDLPQRSFFLKHYRVVAPYRVATHLLRGSAAWREWRNSLEVRRRRVPTATPVAIGENYRAGFVRDSYFVSEAIPHSCTLEQFADEWLPRINPSLRRRMTMEVARFCAAAHRAGVFHTDFHHGNVLVRLDDLTSSSATLHLIDLPRMRFSRPLSWSKSRDSLAMFAATWLDRTSRADRWRFWQEYLRHRQDLRIDDPAASAAEIVRRSHAHAEQILRDRDKRSLKTNRHFYWLASAGAVGHAVCELNSQDLLALLRDPAAPFENARAEVIKQCVESHVIKSELPLNGKLTPMAYKRSRYTRWWKALLGTVRKSRSLRAWQTGHSLLERNIATARPLFVYEPRQGLLRWESYLATEWIGGEPLHEFLQRLTIANPDLRRKQVRQCAAVLGRLLGRMHAWKIAHRDLKAANLLITDRQGQLDPYLIDLDGVRLLRRLSDRRRARNIARLATSMEAHGWVSVSDRLRFLRAYLTVAPLEKRDWKWFWRYAARHSNVLANQMRAEGRAVM